MKASIDIIYHGNISKKKNIDAERAFDKNQNTYICQNSK